MSKVTVSTHPNGITILRLNDPDRRNAMDLAMAADFKTAIANLRNDPTVRSLILTGQGTAFAAGGDLRMLREKTAKTPKENQRDMLDFYESFLCLQSLPIPTIAAVNGHAIGAGFCVAMACDFRVISRDAKLGLNFVNIGLHPGMGATLFAPRLVGYGQATEWLTTGQIFKAAEVKGTGIANQIVPPEDVMNRAVALANQWHENSGEAIADLLFTLRPSKEELNSALQREAMCQAKNFASDDFKNRIESLTDKSASQKSND